MASMLTYCLILHKLPVWIYSLSLCDIFYLNIYFFFLKSIFWHLEKSVVLFFLLVMFILYLYVTILVLFNFRLFSISFF